MHCIYQKLSFLVLLAVITLIVNAGPISYVICQSGCNGLAVACYAAAGATFGTVTAGADTPAIILGCNAALGACISGCVVAGCIPFTP
jgi:hypothetical protein